MRVSYIAMNRKSEERAAKDAAYRRSLAKTGKALLLDARRLSDEELLGKLRSLNLTLDPGVVRPVAR